MIGLRHFLLSMLATAALAMPAFASELIGVYGQWAAFRSEDGDRCHAMRLPEESDHAGAYLSVVVNGNSAPRFYARLARPRGGDASVSVGGRRFSLTGEGRDLFAPDRQMDRALIAAIRSTRALTIETIDRNGRAMVDGYDLTGGASAIDAARIACRVQSAR